MRCVVKKCKTCGRINDFDRELCGNPGCRADIKLIISRVVDSSELNANELKSIDTERVIYVQTCPKCGQKYYLKSMEHKLDYCKDGCKKKQIGNFDPVVFDRENDDFINKESVTKSAENSNKEMSQVNNVSLDLSFDKSDVVENQGNVIEDDLQFKTDMRWANILSDDYDEMSDVYNNTLLELIPTEDTLRKYGDIRYTLRSDEMNEPVILGREREMGGYLSRDPRVGRAHCIISCVNGIWYLTDNNSTNGTMRNKELFLKNPNRIVPMKRVELKQGDTITLGRDIDSIKFIVNIKNL